MLVATVLGFHTFIILPFCLFVNTFVNFCGSVINEPLLFAQKSIQNVFRHTATGKEHTEVFGRLIHLDEVTFYKVSAVSVIVLGYFVTVQTSVFCLALGRYGTFRNIHYLS